MGISDAVAENYGLRIMMMASSLSEVQSYRASFSEALLDLWNTSSPGPTCTDPQQAPYQLRKFITQRLQPQRLGPTEGLPQVVIPYRGKLCLESFATDNGLFVFLNGRPDVVAATIMSGGRPIDDFSFPLPLQMNLAVPYKALRSRYTVVVDSADGSRLLERQADLASDPVTFVLIGPVNPSQLASAYLKTADYASFAGLPNEEAVTYQKRAFATFASAKDENRALDISFQIRANQPEDGDLALAQKLAFPSKVSYSPLSHLARWIFALSSLFIILAYALYLLLQRHARFNETFLRPAQRWTELFAALTFIVAAICFFSFSWSSDLLTTILELQQGPAAVARYEKLAGRFDKAADLYIKAASRPPKGIESQSLAIQAYFAYGAAGQPEEAEEYRMKNNLDVLKRDCPTCVEKEQAAVRESGRGVAHEEFSSLCTARALSKLNL
ncbi:MAG TPA: hypothetical protein VK788_09095 [Terriglobales bacterium]|nr:hypothetical protein [Terriglobales bacterium]